MIKEENIKTNQVVIFQIEQLNYALNLSVVERVLPSVEVTPLPQAPEKILGIINFHGKILPVIDMRNAFNLPKRDISLDDHFIIARTSRRLFALLVDSVKGAFDVNSVHMNDSEKIIPFSELFSGIVIMENNLILISNLEQFLSLKEHHKLDVALKENKL